MIVFKVFTFQVAVFIVLKVISTVNLETNNQWNFGRCCRIREKLSKFTFFSNLHFTLIQTIATPTIIIWYTYRTHKKTS